MITSFSMKSSSRSFSIADISEKIPHKRSELMLFKFILDLELWCEDVSLSRFKYASLRKILQMLELNSELSDLSNSLSTLRRWTKEQLSLLNMWKKEISLNSIKLSFIRATQKISDSISRSSIEFLYFFDLKTLFTIFLSSVEIKQKMHIDLDEFQDVFVELWHSRAWNSSIWIISEQYAHYSAFVENHRELLIFSSNFIRYYCVKNTCQCRQASVENSHIERMLKIAHDFRKESIDLESITLKIQRVITASDVANITLSLFMKTNELLSVNDIFAYLSENAMQMSESDVLLNYLYESWIKTQQQVSWSDQLFVRRIFHFKKQKVRSLN